MTTTTASDVTQYIESQIFATPSGNIRGFIVASLPGKKGTDKIAHAYLLTDKPTEISVRINKGLSIENVELAAKILSAFVDKVRELETAQTPT